MLGVLRTRDFRLLWAGQSVSALGEQFNLIALPWLVLTLTRDPVQLGLVMAFNSTPRALFVLFGGVSADRLPPRTIMLVSDVSSLLLTGVLGVTVLMGTVAMWMVYLTALLLGLLTSFFHPATQSSVARLLEPARLEAGNALMQGTRQLSHFIGPVMAGALIAAFGSAHVAGKETASQAGIGAAFLVDALTFAVAASTLWAIRSLRAAEETGREAPLTAIARGVRFVASHAHLRWLLVIVSLANLMLAGPLMVGIPVLASERLAEGAAAYGLILSAYGGGSLVGMLGAGGLDRAPGRVFGWLVVGVFALFGAAMAALAVVTSTWQALPLMALVGVGNGYVVVTVLALMQRLAPRAMLGRAMSLVLFATFALAPVSQALSGLVVRWSLPGLFLGAGAGLLGIAILAATRRELWTFVTADTEPAAA